MTEPQPSTPSTLVETKFVRLHLKSTEQSEAILEVATQLEDHPSVTNFELFRQDLMAREAAGPTHIGGTVALPHARTTAVQQILVAAGRSEQGVIFRDIGEPVRLIFVVATPRSQIGGYLATVGALARLLRNDQRIQQLLHCGTPAEFSRLLPAS